MTTSREHLLVELVDESGTAIGSCSVAEAHNAPGQRHRAFSVLLYDEAGRVLLQRRAAVKTRFPLLWSNTCCGHPEPGEDTAAAAARRLIAELGLTPEHTTALTEVGVHAYQAGDPGTGRVEREWDHVLVGTLVAGVPVPDPAEVADCTWLSPDALTEDLGRHPEAYTPWLPGVLTAAANSVRAH